MVQLANVIKTLLETIYNLITILLDSILNGFKFLGMSLTYIPNFLINIFNDLPDFLKVGYTGLLGCLLVIVIFKLISIIKGSG